MRTETVQVDPDNPNRDTLKRAAEVIRQGGLVAFPTETVYGIGADWRNKSAMERLRSVKERPGDKPFTVQIGSLEELKTLVAEMNIFQKYLVEVFWPGPMTLILNTASQEKLGVRMPKNRIALELLSECGTPLAVPSANVSGERPPRNAEEVLRSLDGKIDMVLDGGSTELGVESTVVDASAFPYRVVREGAIEKSRIADAGRRLLHIYLE